MLSGRSNAALLDMFLSLAVEQLTDQNLINQVLVGVELEAEYTLQDIVHHWGS
jgi:hypothetical protein